MRKLPIFLIALFLSASSALQAQDADSLLLGDDLDFLLSSDSLSLFRLVDSLLNAEPPSMASQLATRLGYNSNVLAAGRTLGIENFGLSFGLSYYHKSGLFADVSGFGSKDFDPVYYLTIASIGYSHIFNKNFSFITSYDRYFYNTNGDDLYIPYKNSFTFSPLLDIKFANVGIAYSYYFGDKNVHRITPTLGLTVQKRNVGPFTRIALLPSFVLLFGNETFTESEVLIPQTRRQALEYYKTYGKMFPVIETTHTEFGLMNYSFTLPLSLSMRNLNFGITYVYNIPEALSGETLIYSESSFLSANFTYYFALGTYKKPLQ
jgi:hypothetical protein